MELKAKVKQVLPVERGVSKKSGEEWSKATLIVEYGGDRYPKQVALFNFKNADEFANLPLGSEHTFSINIESREFNGRWYTSVECWKWTSASQPQQAAPPAAAPQGDDLPF